MSKQEFLDTLRRALARELSESEVADNINYYWNYIEQQVASGKSEEQVLSELGDPRLIARTILQVDQQKEEAADPNYQNTGSPTLRICHLPFKLCLSMSAFCPFYNNDDTRVKRSCVSCLHEKA